MCILLHSDAIPYKMKLVPNLIKNSFLTSTTLISSSEVSLLLLLLPLPILVLALLQLSPQEPISLRLSESRTLLILKTLFCHDKNITKLKNFNAGKWLIELHGMDDGYPMKMIIQN